MRVLIPALSGALLLALPHACDRAPADVADDRPDDRDEPGHKEGTGPAEPGMAGPIEVAPLGGPSVRRTLRIEASEGFPDPTSVPLTIEGFLDVQLGAQGLPRANAVPSYRWSPEGQSSAWPLVAEAEVPADGERLLVAWLDVDPGGRLDSGDLCSAPVVAPSGTGGGELPFRIDRPWLADGAADAGLPSGREVVFELAATMRPPDGAVGLLVLGFPASGIGDNGFPRRGTLPAFQWKRPAEQSTWPLRLEVPIEGGPDLWLFGVLDLDGDQRLGPGDQLAGPVELPARGTPVVLRVDRALPGRSVGPRGCGGGGPPEPPRGG